MSPVLQRELQSSRPDSEIGPATGTELRLLGVILLVSVVLRLVAAWWLGNLIEPIPGGVDDQRAYDMLARRVVEGHGFTVAQDWWPVTRAGQPTAYWSYLYTTFVATTYWLFGVNPVAARLVQAAATGLLMPWLSFRIGRRLGGAPVGMIAAAWTAGYGYFVFYAAALMTESFFITALLASVDRALAIAAGDRSRMRWIQLGTALAVAALLRQVFVIAVPLLLFFATCDRESRSLWSRCARANAHGILVACVVMAVWIAPWTAHNYRVFGRLVPINTNAGFNLYWGNHPVHGTRYAWDLPAGETYENLVPVALRGLDEASLDAALFAEGLELIEREPARFARLSLSRAATYFQAWPSRTATLGSNVVRMGSFGLAVPFMLYGLLVAFKTGGQWWILWAFAGFHSVVHLSSQALIRHRLPVDAVLLIVAALGLCELLGRVRGFNRRSLPARRGRP
jgi:4-amino-4-deoxy-L-arabinose transferase-like glycosyltransferase